jgi:hypothetical protein
MNGIHFTGLRKLVCSLSLTALLPLALPAHAAPQKLFDIKVTSGSTTTVTYENLSKGNSNINSISLQSSVDVANLALQPYLTTGTTTISPTSCTTASGCPAGTLISIANINGIVPGTTGYVTMTASVPLSPDSCSTSITFSAQAFTGNALGGVNFLTPSGSKTDTESGIVACVLQFVTQPANSKVSTNITSANGTPNGTPVQVQALIGGSVATSFNGTIQLSVNPVAPTTTTPNLTGGSVSASSGVATFGSPPNATALTIDATGTYSLTASASGFTSATSNPFRIFTGVLNCSDAFPTNIINPGNIASGQPGYAYGNRNAWNKDGVTDGPCVPVLYTFMNNILASSDPSLLNTVNLTWDTATQVNAAFQYTVNWQPVAVDSAASGWSSAPRPQVAWLDKNGNLASGATQSANIAWIPGLACVSDTLPVPYGTLASALGTTVDANSTSEITINGIPPVPTTLNPAGQQYTTPTPGSPDIPAVPFPAVIADTINGTATERMTAIAVIGSPVHNGDGSWNITYQVRRGTATEGSPTALGVSTIESHAAGTLVMSTPLPIIPNDTTVFKAPYKVNTQAQICIAKHGFTSFVIDANGNTQVYYETTIFDIGDGWVLGR